MASHGQSDPDDDIQLVGCGIQKRYVSRVKPFGTDEGYLRLPPSYLYRRLPRLRQSVPKRPSIARCYNVIDLPCSDMVRPAPVNSRPLDALDNPYPYGCSKLCNHPIDVELRKEYRDVTKRAKENAWENEYKTFLLPDEELAIASQRHERRLKVKSCEIKGKKKSKENLTSETDNELDSEEESEADDELHDEDKIPEELVLKYTENISDTTCPKHTTMVPSKSEKASNFSDKAIRPKIVLDANKDHETVYSQVEEKKLELIDTSANRVSLTAKDTLEIPRDNRAVSPTSSISSKRSSVVSSIRGRDQRKPRKRNKTKSKNDSFERSILDDYPDHTQVGVDDIEDSGPKENDSTEEDKKTSKVSEHGIHDDIEKVLEEGNPLERRAMTSLMTHLNTEKPASDMDDKRLQEQQEFISTTVREKCNKVSSRMEAEIQNLEKELNAKIAKKDDDEDVDFWLKIPRTFSFQSSRFELPLDLSILNNLTPVAYLARFVTISSSRRMLYDKVFVRNRSLKDGQVNEETTITALQEVMGGLLNEDHQTRLWTALGIVLKPQFFVSFNFREFSGIAAFFERIFCKEFATSPNRIQHQEFFFARLSTH